MGKWHYYNESDCDLDDSGGGEPIVVRMGIVCSWCCAELLDNRCEHQVLRYNATNCEYEYINESFVKYLRDNKIRNEDYDEVLVPEGDSESEPDQSDIPSPKELHGIFDKIDFYEFCDTDNRTYYQGEIYGYAESKFWQDIKQ